MPSRAHIRRHDELFSLVCSLPHRMLGSHLVRALAGALGKLSEKRRFDHRIQDEDMMADDHLGYDAAVQTKWRNIARPAQKGRELLCGRTPKSKRNDYLGRAVMSTE